MHETEPPRHRTTTHAHVAYRWPTHRHRIVGFTGRHRHRDDGAAWAGVIVIPIGLGILGLEFAWARRWLKTVKEKAEAVARSVTKSGPASGATPPSGGS